MCESGSTYIRALFDIFIVLALHKLLLFYYCYYINKGFFKHFTSKKDDESIPRLLTDFKNQQFIITHNHTWPSGEIWQKKDTLNLHYTRISNQY